MPSIVPAPPTVALLALTAGLVFAPPLRAAELAPVPAGATASDEVRLAAKPTRLEFAAGQAKASALGELAAGGSTEFLFAGPAAGMVTAGVASKSGEARLTIYPPGSDVPLRGTEPEVGLIRWIGSFGETGDYRLVAHTKGVATPVRVEISVSPRE